jgi:DNA-binding MarR family transcriptional regulator
MKQTLSPAMEFLKSMRTLTRHFMDQERRDSRFSRSLGRHGEVVIFLLGEHGDLTMGQLAGAVGLSVSSMTVIVDGLEKAGYVTRERSQDDRRVVRLRNTSKGRKIHQNALNAQVRFARLVLSVLNAGEQRILLSLHGKIGKRLSASLRGLNLR